MAELEMKKPSFGLAYFRAYEKDGETHFAWRFRWWYAAGLILKTMFIMLFDRNVYAEHTTETEEPEECGEETK